jgi:hypothetical protein
MKICPVEAKLFPADRWMDGRADTTNLIMAFAFVVDKTTYLK